MDLSIVDSTVEQQPMPELLDSGDMTIGRQVIEVRTRAGTPN